MNTAADVAGLGNAVAASGRVSRWAMFQPVMLVWLALAIVLIFLIVAPMEKLVSASFEQQGTGGFTLENYATAYGKQRHVQALWNTVKMGAAVVASLVPAARASRVDVVQALRSE